MSRREWRSILPMIIGTVISVGIVSVTGVIFSSVTGHASDDALARVERESRTRDREIETELRDHRKLAEREWRTQAQFRGAVTNALQIEAPKEVLR